MKVHHTLICFFFLSLQDGNSEDTNEHLLFYRVPGGDVTVGFGFVSPGTWKMFCREKCEGENILIETTDDRAQSGRYKIEYGYKSPHYVLSVSISKLSTSDSGQYRCALGGSSSSSSYRQFGVVVAEALLDGNDDRRKKHFYKEPGSSLTVGCSFKDSGSRKFFCRGECGGDKIIVDTNDDRAQRGRYRIRYDSGVLYVSITQLSRSDSGRYRCHQEGTSSRSFREFEITVRDAATTTITAQSFISGSGSSTPSSTFTGTTEESEGAAPTDVSLYVGLTLAATIILLSVALLIFCKKRSSKANNGPVETEHAAVTEEEDDSSKLTYSEVRFFKTSVGSPDSAPCRNTDKVIYSAPRARVSSDCRDDPLYSTVA